VCSSNENSCRSSSHGAVLSIKSHRRRSSAISPLLRHSVVSTPRRRRSTDVTSDKLSRRLGPTFALPGIEISRSAASCDWWPFVDSLRSVVSTRWTLTTRRCSPVPLCGSCQSTATRSNWRLTTSQLQSADDVPSSNGTHTTLAESPDSNRVFVSNQSFRLQRSCLANWTKQLLITMLKTITTVTTPNGQTNQYNAK